MNGLERDIPNGWLIASARRRLFPIPVWQIAMGPSHVEAPSSDWSIPMTERLRQGFAEVFRHDAASRPVTTLTQLYSPAYQPLPAAPCRIPARAGPHCGRYEKNHLRSPCRSLACQRLQIPRTFDLANCSTPSITSAMRPVLPDRAFRRQSGMLNHYERAAAKRGGLAFDTAG